METDSLTLYIDIFDYVKMVLKYGEKKVNWFRNECHKTYVYKIFGKQVMIGYYGDIIITTWSMNIEEGSNEELKDMLDWIMKNAKIDTWEVWTFKE